MAPASVTPGNVTEERTERSPEPEHTVSSGNVYISRARTMALLMEMLM